MFYSDLISEIVHKKNIESGAEIVKSINKKFNYNINIEHYSITTKEQSIHYNRKIGNYDLMSLQDVLYLSRKEVDYAIKRLAEILNVYLDDITEKSRVLVVGLGNRHIVADSLGTKVVSNINITFEGLKLPKVMAICPSVLGLTGIESSDIVSSIVNKVKPTHLILIDSLCASSPERLGKSIQVTNTGICPGSGIGNKRKCIDNTLCDKVVSIGVPLLIYSSTFVYNCFENNDINLKAINCIMQKLKKVPDNEKELNILNNIKKMINAKIDDVIVSIKDIEECVGVLSKIISRAINKVLGVALNDN